MDYSKLSFLELCLVLEKQMLEADHWKYNGVIHARVSNDVDFNMQHFKSVFVNKRRTPKGNLVSVKNTPENVRRLKMANKAYEKNLKEAKQPV